MGHEWRLDDEFHERRSQVHWRLGEIPEPMCEAAGNFKSMMGACIFPHNQG
jgi:hypothetical protein